MKKYKTRDGVILSSICNEYILIAAKNAREYCPYITELNDIGAFIYRHLEQGNTADQIIQEVKKEYESDQNTEDTVMGFIKELSTMGYIYEEE